MNLSKWHSILVIIPRAQIVVTLVQGLLVLFLQLIRLLIMFLGLEGQNKRTSV